jgi:hypothetical protein
VTVERLEAAIMVVARSIADTGEVTHVPLLERLESELAKMKSARDGVSRARQIVGEKVLGPVDSKDSLLGANQIQSCFWGGSLGCEGPFGFERCGMGADGALDHRPARPEGLHWTG